MDERDQPDMPQIELTSLQNPLVKSIRKLHQAKGRREQQQFLLEGTHLVQEALAVGYPFSVVCCTADWQRRHADLWAALVQQAGRSELVTDKLLEAMSTTVHPDGVVAVAPHRPTLAQAPLPSLGVAVETLQDPGNLGALIRTATAVDADGLWLSQDSVDIEHPKVLRSSAGQWFRLPLYRCPDLSQQVAQWRVEGIQVLGTRADAPQDFWSIDFCRPTVIVLGNEGSGLSEAIQQQVSDQVRIPVNAAVESLNVAVAAALLLYEAKRQRRPS